MNIMMMKVMVMNVKDDDESDDDNVNKYNIYKGIYKGISSRSRCGKSFGVN
jgi:hypothetical protein